MRTIAVKDANGDELTLYEFIERRLLREVRRMKLETGELVNLVDGSLIIAATGEKLVRIGES